MNCPQCNGNSEVLGQLGNLVHLRCRNCGWQDSCDAPEFYGEGDDDGQDYEPDDAPWDDDRFADGEALASAGWGTDEDYNCFDSGDY